MLEKIQKRQKKSGKVKNGVEKHLKKMAMEKP